MSAIVALFAIGCSDTTAPRHSPGPASFDHTYGYIEDPRRRCWGLSEPYTYYRDGDRWVRCVQQWAIAEDIGSKAIIDKTFRGPLHITFTEPVYKLVVESSGAYLCSGSTYGTATATFASGRQEEIPFEKGGSPNDCGDDDIGGALRLTVPGDEGVTSIVITEMLPRSWTNSYGDQANSSGRYEMTFDRFPPCPPAGTDPIINHREFRKVTDSLLVLSNIADPQRTNRRERLAYVWEDRFTYELRFDISPTVGEPCSIGIASLPDTDTTVLVGAIHTHPGYAGENVKIACNNPKAGPYNPTALGGGSTADWLAATQRLFVDVYSVSPEYFHRLDTELRDSTSWGKNPVRWKRDRNSGCPSL